LKGGTVEILEKTLTNQNSIQKEITSRLNSRKACYNSVQDLLSSSLLSETIKIKMYKNIILPVLYGCEIWSPTFREERRLRVFENGVLWRIFGPKRDEVTREWEKLDKEKINHLYSSRNIIRVIKSRRMRWAVHVA
jgi:hypothetical protein